MLYLTMKYNLDNGKVEVMKGGQEIDRKQYQIASK